VIPTPVSPEAWATEGRRVAPALEEVAAALVIGSDPDIAALIALEIARAHAPQRRVAIADLVGGLDLLTPVRDGPGLIQCLRDGTPVSEIGAEIAGTVGIFALPSGTGAIAERWIFESARWERLIGGFREVDALLLLVAPPSAPGLATLIERVDGVVAVDLPPTFVRAWPLLATVDRPEAELPLIAPGTPRQTPGGTAVATARPTSWRFLVSAAVVLGIGLSWAYRTDRLSAFGFSTGRSETNLAASPAAAMTEPPEIVHIALGPIVNPGDSARAVSFAVELVAANTLAGANSRLVLRGVDLPSPTIAPVQRAGGRTWFRAVVGAWSERIAAEQFLDGLRERGVVAADVGRVLTAPYAMLLARGLSVTEMAEAIAEWEARGIRAYGLLQDDGSVRLFAGAFETSDQAVLLAMSLRDLGAEPHVAYRTGRMF